MPPLHCEFCLILAQIGLCLRLADAWVNEENLETASLRFQHFQAAVAQVNEMILSFEALAAELGASRGCPVFRRE